MAKLPHRYTTEFREQMVALHRSGRSCNALAKEFGVSNWAIRQWVKQADGSVSRGDELTRVERDELVRLQRENRRLKEECEILSKAAAWFANERRSTPKRSSDS
jgi:transposase